jgi:hypothetical protein
MSVIVEVPGHGEVEFPDGMSDEEMSAAIRKNFMLAAPEKPKQTMGGRVAQTGASVLQGLMRGGPLGAAAAGVGEGLNQSGEVMDRLAYDAGGKVTDLTGSPELGFAANVATQAVPTVVGAAAGKLASPLLKSGGKQLMMSALKPSKAEHMTGKAGRAAQTMLDEGVSVSQGGVDKMRSAISSLNDEIAGIIKNSGKTVDKNAVASRLQDVMKKYEASIDASDLQAIEKVWTEFLTHPQLAGKSGMPVQLAQRMKQAGNAKLGDAAYGMGLKPAAERDAYKGLVRGLKEEIAAAEPAVAPLNAREGNLLNAEKIAQNRVAMDANKNPIGLGILNPLTLPLWMFDRSPLAKSMLARLMYSGAGPIGTGAGAAAGGIYGAQQGQPPSGILYP